MGPQNLGSRRGPPGSTTAPDLNLSGFHTTMGLSTPDMLQVTLAPHLASLTTMGIFRKHLVCFTPAAQVGWNQLKPVWV